MPASRRRPALLAVLIATALGALGGVFPAHAAEGDLLIANRGFRVTVLGPMRPHSDATRQAAVRAFGPDFRLSAPCRCTWPAIGLSIQMTNFGGGDPCAFAQLLTISGPESRRWRTERGLRVGDPLARVRRLYPAARRKGVLWRLTAARSPYGNNRMTAVIWAVVADGRVAAIRGWIGGAGD